MEKQRLEISVSTETLIKILLVAVVPFFLWLIRDIIFILLVSVTLASGMEPLVDTLRAKKVPRGVSVIAVYLLAIAIIVFSAFIVFPPFIREFNDFSANSDQILADFNQRLGGGENQGVIQRSLAKAVADGVGSFGGQLTFLSDRFFETTVGFFNGFVKVLTILVITFYLVAERNGMKHLVMTFVPAHHQSKVHRIINKIQSKVGSWMFGQFLLCVIIFAMTWLMLTLLGVKYALVLALLAGFMELIPYVGPFISAVPGIFIAFLQDPTLAIVVAVMYYIIQASENYYLVPKIMYKTVGLSPIVVLVSLLVGLRLAGLLGVLLAVPVVAGINVVIQELWHKPADSEQGVQASSD
jgi:predicted PurR-regulated permease PerM